MEKKLPKTVQTKEGKQHFSVGAVIEKSSKVLIMERMLPPKGFAGIAGHVDHGEKPSDALIREIKEETNLDVINSCFLFKKVINQKEECTFGVRRHKWYIYNVKVRGEIMPAKREVKTIEYMSKDRLKKLYREKKLEYAWAVIFKKLKIV